MGIGRNQWIITRHYSRRAYLASSSNWEMITCVETITGDSAVLPPMFIFLAAQYMKHGFNANLAKKVVFAVLEFGYTNNKINQLSDLESEASRESVRWVGCGG